MTVTLSTASDGTGKKKGMTVTVTADDIKYKTTQELWAGILKTFGGNEATKKTKKNLLKQQYGNFKTEGSETLEQKFNRLLAPEWLMHTIVWRNRSDLDTMSLDDLYNHLKVYESEVEKKSEPNSQNMAFISSTKHSSRNEEVNTASVSTASANIGVATISQDTACAYIASESSGSVGLPEAKIEEGNTTTDKENHALVADEEAPTKFTLMAKTSAESEVFDNSLCSKDYLDNLLKSQRLDKNKEGLGYSIVPPPPAQIYSPPKKDMSWTGLPEFKDDNVTDYSRPTPAIESTFDDAQNRNPSVTKTKASPSTISPKSFIKFVKANDSPTKSKTNKVETAKKPPVKCAEQYRIPTKNPNVRGNQRNWNNLKSHQLVRSQFRDPKVATVNRKFPTANRKLPTVNWKFPTGNTKFSTADMGNKGKAGSSQKNIDDKGYWDSGCSRHMTGNISYLSNYEPFDGGYVSFGQGGCKITGKGTIKTGKPEFENIYFMKDLKTPRQHNMYSIDLNNIVPHKDLTCLVAKASADECMSWHRRLGKQHQASCKSKLVNSVTKPLHTLHMDLFGPTSVSSISHKWNRNGWEEKLKNVGVLKLFSRGEGRDRKGEGKEENLKDLKVKIIMYENGGEFRNKKMNDFCSQKGIKREFSNARTPQQNDVVERRNMTLIEAAKTMLADAKIPITFWAEAVNKTPYELFNKKFEAKGDEGYFIGYSMSSKAFRAIEKGAGPNWLFDIESLTKSMNYVPVDAGTNSTNLSGIKDAGSQEVKKDVSSLRYIALPNWVYDALLESSSTDQLETLIVETPIPTISSPVPTACFTDSQEPSSDTRLISKRVANQVDTPSLDNILTLTNRFEDILGVTTNSVDSDGVEANKVWSLVDCPKGVRLIGTKWVLKNKKDEREIVIRNKARLVAQGHTQEERIDYDEVFAPVARIKAIRLFLAYASFMGFTIYQMDVKSAFLFGTTDEGVGTIDQTLFIRRQRGDFILVQVYVDDIIFGSSNLQLCREFEALIREKFQMSAMGELNFFLGLQVLQKEDGIFLSQDKSMIGSLMYLTTSRPDIMFVVCAYARHQVIPKECHLHVVKRIFRYLKCHLKLGLWYPKESPFDLVAYSDSDYGGATQDRKSTTEGCQFLGRRLISWQCKKQKIVATLTTEAEYVAAASCCGQVLWIQNQLLDYGEVPVLVVEAQFKGITSSIVSQFVFGWVIRTSKYWGVLRILMISLRLIPLSEHNVDFHPIVDFVEASPLRRNLKLHDEEGISSLPDVELFENLTLMRYNVSPNQKFTFQKGQFSYQWKYLIHTIMQCLSPKSTGFNEFSSNIATALVCLATNRVYNFSKMIFDGMVKNVNNKVSKFLIYLRRARIAQSSVIPPVADEPASPLRDVSQAQELEINMLKARVKLLEDREGEGAKRYGDDAPIKGRNLDDGEAAAERVSDDTEEMATVLTSMDATIVLASRVAEVPTGSGSIPTAGPPAAEVPTGSDVVPTVGLIFAIATVVTPYTRRKGKETMVESETPKKKKVQEQIDAQIMIDGLDRSNETVAKYLQEYHQFATELPLERRIELISDLIRYQDNYAKVHKFWTQQRKPWSKKQKRDYYMAVIKSNLGWKVKDFRGMTFKEIKAKFTTLWKQIENFIPIGSKEEAERFKRKGIRFEQESVKKLKTSEKVPGDVKTPDEVPKEKVKEMMQLVPIEEITRLEGSSASYQFFVDMLKHLDREDLNQFWALVKKSLSIRPPTRDKEMELWLYDTCRVHHVTSKDKEIFMLVEKDYPFKKGLAIGMISYKLQVENYSKMANDLILKIYKIERIVGNKMHKAFLLPVIELPLLEEVPTASEEVPTASRKGKPLL
nr:hypothetical protein [Tanacetum cinerariifolium]